MSSIETTKPNAKESLLHHLKNHLLNHKTSTIYDILRPIYYCSLPFGMTQFHIRAEKFKNCIWIIFWNSIIVVVAATLALIALTSRVYDGKVGAMYTITDVAVGWVSSINIAVIILFGCFFKKRVSVHV